jgi:alpha-L-rhamnosidase
MKAKNSPQIVSRFLLLPAAALILAWGAARLHGASADIDRSPVQGLRCEYLVDPPGIDVEIPRLSWMLNPSSGLGAPKAYRILVASSLDALRRDQGDLWDSGRVSSADSTWVPYAGKKLLSGQRVYWKVRVWGDNGKATPWSGSATWSMGLLQASDWHAKWIGERRPDGVAEGTPLPFPQLRKTFTLAAKPSRAVAHVNPLGYYELYINGKKVDDHVLSPAVSD